MKHLNNCLSVSKILLNVEKTELGIFKSTRKVDPLNNFLKTSWHDR